MKDVFVRLGTDFLSTIVFIAIYWATGNVVLATGVAIAGAIGDGKANWVALAVGLATLIVILLLKDNKRLPGILIAVVGATILVAALDLGSRYGVKVLGPLPQGLPAFPPSRQLLSFRACTKVPPAPILRSCLPSSRWFSVSCPIRQATPSPRRKAPSRASCGRIRFVAVTASGRRVSCAI